MRGTLPEQQNVSNAQDAGLACKFCRLPLKRCQKLHDHDEQGDHPAAKPFKKSHCSMTIQFKGRKYGKKKNGFLLNHVGFSLR